MNPLHQKQHLTDIDKRWLEFAQAIMELAREDYIRAVHEMKPGRTNGHGYAKYCNTEAIEAWLRNGADNLIGRADPEDIIVKWRREAVRRNQFLRKRERKEAEEDE